MLCVCVLLTIHISYLFNRKALASTSATPGHTTKFHFFHVNEGRKVYIYIYIQTLLL